MRKLTKAVLALGGAAVLGASGALVAYAADNGNHGAHGQSGQLVYICFNDKDSSHNYIEFSGAPNGCAGHPGYSQWVVASDQYKGNAGAQGAAGQSATLQTSGTTAVTAWPETSGWAMDAFNRSVTLTRQHAASSASCGADAGSCWFYTATQSDTGSFAATDGQPSPNVGTPITNSPTGTMVGGTSVEFYANNATPDGSKLPAAQSGKGAVGTSDWVSQAFPAGTKFSAFTLPKYTWTYTAADGEKWTDSIGPGSDGKDAASGDITGVAAH